ncbi:competence protein CoiA [Mesorhizobium sp. AaZ16]|uniref:competence protein CoiA n=1 Tax=Mesorhizobium sp. AaZ16 TaxID=3402289 RepID=UPI00374E21BC
MQYALVDRERREPFPGGRGVCTTCGSAMISKCGPRIMHHWAHFGRRICDPWWENETPWHREWKNRFPEECREISHIAPDGEIHRADIKTPSGIVIEVQHSAMTDAERLSREAFYGNLVWVVDGSVFKQNFDVYHELPAPESELGQDLVWEKAERHMHGTIVGMCVRLSECRLENPEATKTRGRGGTWLFMHEIRQQVIESYRGHHQYDWVRPRRTWLDATCPVYIDLGGDSMARLETYDESGLPCIYWVCKRRFVRDVMAKADARAVAVRVLPIPATTDRT